MNFGCKVNQAEGLRLEEEILARGGAIVAAPDAATHVVINTCAVTSSAERQVRQLVRRIARGNPSCRIVVAGCYADRDATGAAALPGNVVVLTNAEKSRIPGSLLPESLPRVRRFETSRTRPILKIQDGCNLSCAFCIVPTLRGRTIRSVSPEEVLAECRAYGEAGFAEVILSGVLLGAYGLDLEPRVSLADLLARLDGRCPPVRISSIEPWRITPRVVELLGTSAHLRPHVHIPIQSGSPAVLKRMNRRCNPDRIHDCLTRLRQLCPDIAVGTDVMAGFPAETDAEFEQTVRLVEDLNFSYLHVFPFSPRPGTPAATMSDRIPHHVVAERCGILRRISREASYAFRSRFVGRELDAVVLSQGDQALTGNYIRTNVPPGTAPGATRVRVVRASPESTEAIVVARQSRLDA
ncbi:MAG: MiaB/RimO family radical SAM methylthiotransferase [Acidobacteriota bacterium]